jgi:hypothetical protein
VSRTAAAALILEIAAGVAIQASGVGGPDVAAGAAGTFVATVLYLAIDARRIPISEQISRFALSRSANIPEGADIQTLDEYNLDTIECFDRQFGRAVRAEARRLRKEALIGRREEHQLSSPSTPGDIDALTRRFRELDR